MAVILDANALINLYRAEVLSLIYLATECIVPAEVYAEAVTNGQIYGYPDSSGIAEIIGPCNQGFVEIPTELENMGLGEAAVLARYMERSALASTSGDIIVSDDRQFLRRLARLEVSSREIFFFDTAHFVTDCVRAGWMTKSQAAAAIVRLRSQIPEGFFRSANQQLELL